MDVIEFGLLTARQRRQLEGDEHDPFDAAGSTLQFRRKEHHVALRDRAGRLVASTGIVLVEIEVDSRRFAVVGLGGVIVTARYRGQGLARRVVDAALAKARTLGPDFAILFCLDDRAVLYRKLGFVEVRSVVLVEQPEGHVPISQRTMWRALKPDVTWPAGEVVVDSLPF